jgi:NTE family protein
VSVRALVLSGGGAKGAYEAGVITSLWKAQPFDIIVGTSIGAMNAAITAQHNVAALEPLWTTVASRNVVQPLPTVAHAEAFLQAFSDWQSLPPIAKASHIPHLTLLWMQVGSKSALFTLLGAFDDAPIEALLKQFVDFNALSSTLIVTSTNITTRVAAAFYAFAGAASANLPAFQTNAGVPTAPISQLNYVDVLKASAAIPAAFSPVVMNLGSSAPELFVDGGVANNTPIGLAIAAGADDVTVILLEPPSNPAPSPPPRNLVDVAYACYDVMQQKILEVDLKLAGLTNEMLSTPLAPQSMRGRLAGKRIVGLQYVRPQSALPLSVLDFGDQSKIDAAFAQGVADGEHPQTF